MYTFLYKLHDNTLPKTLNDMFTPNYEIHQHHTRNRNNPHILHRRTAISEHSIVFSGPTLWQQLPPSHKQIKTIHSFTREIKRMKTHDSKLLKYSHPRWAYCKTKCIMIIILFIYFCIISTSLKKETSCLFLACICVYACMCVCVCVCVCVCMYMYVYIYIYICIRVYMYVCV